MTASTFGPPPLDVQPASWREFFKLRHGLKKRMCYSGRWKSSPGQPEVTYDFLITLIGEPKPLRGEAPYTKVRGAIRWTLMELPDTYEWLADRVRRRHYKRAYEPHLMRSTAGGLCTRIRVGVRRTTQVELLRTDSSLKVLLRRGRRAAHSRPLARRSRRGSDRHGSIRPSHQLRWYV